MLPTLLLLAMTLPQAEVNHFAARVAQALAQRPGARVLLSVEDTAATGASEQLARALRESLRQRGFELTAESDAAVQVNAWLSLRRGRPLAVARITAEGREAAILFAEFELTAQPATPVSERPAVAIRTRTLIESDLPVLDIETDSAGNLFVLHTDRLRAHDLNAAGTPLKAEIGLETGSGRQRDPLVRLFAREQAARSESSGSPAARSESSGSPARQLEIYSAAPVPPPPPLPVEGYTLKAFSPPAPWRFPHPLRAVTASIQAVAGRNYFRALGAAQSGAVEIVALAPVASPLRAHWVLLDTGGRLRLADADLRPLGAAGQPGALRSGSLPAGAEFGGGVASVTLACAGTLVLAASAQPAPERDRVAVLRLENDRLVPATDVVLEGAVKALEALPPGAAAPAGYPPGVAADLRRVLAVVEKGAPTRILTRIEEIELRCQ